MLSTNVQLSRLRWVFGLVLFLLFTLFYIMPAEAALTTTLTGGSALTNEVGTSSFITDLQITSSETNPTVPIKLQVSKGTLSMASTTGLTFYNSSGGALSNPQTGSMLHVRGSLSDVNAALATLKYTRTTSGTGTDTLVAELIQPGDVFFGGHFYEYIIGGNNWGNANSAAINRYKYGARGYLASITSQAENNFVSARLYGDGWMSANDRGSEGAWVWLNGPENGQALTYTNWASGEPNNDNDEDCGQFLYSKGGQWNDINCEEVLSGYVVEYGAPGNMPEVSTLNVAITTMTAADIALLKIKEYADSDGTAEAPSIEDYTAAGIVDVTTDNIDAINVAVLASEGTDVDTTAELRAVVNPLISLEKINSYAETDGASTDVPTITDYENAGVSGITSNTLAAMNELIAASSPVDLVDGGMQSLADKVVALAKIKAYADSDGASAAPTAADYAAAGITGITDNNLTEVNVAMAASEADDVDSVEKIQAILNPVVALVKIQEYADTDGVSAAPTVEDYAIAGVSGVTENFLNGVNESVANSDANSVANLSSLQSFVENTIREIRRLNERTSGGTHFGCKDTNASNYEYFASHKQSLCKYGTAQPNKSSESLLSPVIPPSTPAIPVFARDLKVGSIGEDVRALQKFLNTNGFSVATIGVGSSGKETDTFGALTRAALAKFQLAKGITPAVGYFGPKTRAVLNTTGTAPTANQLTITTTPININVRNFPIDGNVLGTVPSGTQGTVVDSQENWIKVKFQNLEGWVYKPLTK